MLFSLKNSIIAAVIRDFILIMVSFMICATTKGFIKALASYIQGDITPKNDGFLSFNPLNHCDISHTAPIAAILILISKALNESSSVSRLITVVAITFLESSIYPMTFGDKDSRADIKIALSNLAGIAMMIFLLTTPLPFLFKLSFIYDLKGPEILILRDIFGHISTFAFISLIINLPPIPPRDGFYVIRPFLSYKAERFLEQLRENFLIYIMVCFVSAMLLLPLAIYTFNISTEIMSTAFQILANSVAWIASLLKR